MKRIFSLSLLTLFLSIAHHGFSQSLLVGIPSADVAEKHALEITHESQINVWQQPAKWNSFNIACWGLGHNAELTATFNNLDNESLDNASLSVGGKKVFELRHGSSWEPKLTAGANGMYSPTRRDIGYWTYGHMSVRLPKTRTRITGGISAGSAHLVGFRMVRESAGYVKRPHEPVCILAGIEQPIYKNISFILDWYSGKHDLAALIPAVQLDVKHHVLILGYKIPNDKRMPQAAIVEFMYNLPMKKSHRH